MEKLSKYNQVLTQQNSQLTMNLKSANDLTAKQKVDYEAALENAKKVRDEEIAQRSLHIQPPVTQPSATPVKQFGATPGKDVTLAELPSADTVVPATQKKKMSGFPSRITRTVPTSIASTSVGSENATSFLTSSVTREKLVDSAKGVVDNSFALHVQLIIVYFPEQAKNVNLLEMSIVMQWNLAKLSEWLK